eukprot:30959-Pelagococcus_subviridis.AAC.9
MQKSLRIGVHHANAVAWEPAYRTRLIRALEQRPLHLRRVRRHAIRALERVAFALQIPRRLDAEDARLVRALFVLSEHRVHLGVRARALVEEPDVQSEAGSDDDDVGVEARERAIRLAHPARRPRVSIRLAPHRFGGDGPRGLVRFAARAKHDGRAVAFRDVRRLGGDDRGSADALLARAFQHHAQTQARRNARRRVVEVHDVERALHAFEDVHRAAFVALGVVAVDAVDVVVRERSRERPVQNRTRKAAARARSSRAGTPGRPAADLRRRRPRPSSPPAAAASVRRSNRRPPPAARRRPRASAPARGRRLRRRESPRERSPRSRARPSRSGRRRLLPSPQPARLAASRGPRATRTAPRLRTRRGVAESRRAARRGAPSSRARTPRSRRRRGPAAGSSGPAAVPRVPRRRPRRRVRVRVRVRVQVRPPRRRPRRSSLPPPPPRAPPPPRPQPPRALSRPSPPPPRASPPRARATSSSPPRAARSTPPPPSSPPPRATPAPAARASPPGASGRAASRERSRPRLRGRPRGPSSRRARPRTRSRRRSAPPRTRRRGRATFDPPRRRAPAILHLRLRARDEFPRFVHLPAVLVAATDFAHEVDAPREIFRCREQNVVLRRERRVDEVLHDVRAEPGRDRVGRELLRQHRRVEREKVRVVRGLERQLARVSHRV